MNHVICYKSRSVSQNVTEFLDILFDIHCYLNIYCNKKFKIIL